MAIFIAWLAVSSGAQVGLTFFYVIPIAVATWWFGERAGAIFALSCLALYLVGDSIHPIEHLPGSLAVRASVFFASVVAVATLRTRILKLEHSADELEAIRLALTPPSMPAHAGVDVAAAFIPSELGVSGDFYLLTNSPDGSTIAVVGDVVGHGPKAAQLATFIRARLATFAANSSDPAEILTLANDALLERPGRGEELVSAVCLRFHSETKNLSWAVAGHPPPLELPGLKPLRAPGTTLLLGVDSGISLENAEARLEPDTGILVYTDGATDLRLEEGAMLGLDGLRRLVEPVAHLAAEALVGEVEETLMDRVSGTIRDDICVLVLRPAG